MCLEKCKLIQTPLVTRDTSRPHGRYEVTPNRNIYFHDIQLYGKSNCGKTRQFFPYNPKQKSHGSPAMVRHGASAVSLYLDQCLNVTCNCRDETNICVYSTALK